jgi:hypothetical protein
VRQGQAERRARSRPTGPTWPRARRSCTTRKGATTSW